jgi:hypothetical protein
MPRVNFFALKISKKSYDLKVLGLFTKLYPRVLDLAATLDSGVIFIILKITLNLHDPSLSGSGYNTRPNRLGCRSDCKVVS